MLTATNVGYIEIKTANGDGLAYLNVDHIVAVEPLPAGNTFIITAGGRGVVTPYEPDLIFHKISLVTRRKFR